MKTKKLRKTNLVFITAVFFAMASVSFAAQTAADQTTTTEVKEKVAAAAAAIKNYSVDQRDQALQKAKAVLDGLDARIDRMQSQLNEKWDQMDKFARQEAMDSLTMLRKQRNDIAEWYGGLKHSSGKAWEDVKQGFLKSYQVLRDTFDKVKGEF